MPQHDFVPQPSRIPFTNREVFEAFALFMPKPSVEVFEQELGVAADDPCRFALVTDGILLALSTLSPEHAERVIAFRPNLQPRIAEVQQNPEAFLQHLRDAAVAEQEGSGS